jgi:hypothetical protein
MPAISKRALAAYRLPLQQTHKKPHKAINIAQIHSDILHFL